VQHSLPLVFDSSNTVPYLQSLGPEVHNMSHKPHHDQRDRTVPVFVDGEKVELTPCDTRASVILEAAGVDPAHFDLGRKQGNDTTRYSDDDVIDVKPGLRFFTIRECATVA